MSSKIKMPNISGTITKKTLAEQGFYTPQKLSHRYINISEDLFIKISHIAQCVDWIYARDPNQTYNDAEEDVYVDQENWIQVYSFAKCNDIIVHVEHQQRLYSCSNILEAVDLIREIQANEALKIIPKDKSNVYN